VAQDWGDFALVTGGASGALTGLPNLVVVLLALVGGCLQLAGEDGLYWVAAASTMSLVGGVVNAWLFLTRS
jgi:hypothetical protein